MIRFRSFPELLNAQCAHNESFLFEEDNHLSSITYGQFIQIIKDYPLIPAQRVGIFARNDLDSITSIFAAAYQKKDIILLNPRDEENILRDQIREADVAYLIADEEEKETYVSSLVKDIPSNDPKILFFTSGTTSHSKAVILSEEKLCAAAYNGGYCLPLREDDILLCLLPLSHVFGFVCSLLWGLSFGCRIALSRGTRGMMTDLSFYHPTVISLVSQIAGFYDRYHLFNPELRQILIGAGDCPESIMESIRRQGIALSFGYGLTETSSGVALSLGEDPRKMTICPLNDIRLAQDGEILIKSKDIMFDGYYKREEETKEAFDKDYFKTGDIGSFDENHLLTIKGRKKEVLILSDGNKLFLPEYKDELEKYLMDDDFAVIQTENKQIKLIIYTKKEHHEIETSVTSFNKHMTRGKQITSIEYSDQKLPRTQTGKIKRYLLH